MSAQGRTRKDWFDLWGARGSLSFNIYDDIAQVLSSLNRMLRAHQPSISLIYYLAEAVHGLQHRSTCVVLNLNQHVSQSVLLNLNQHVSQSVLLNLSQHVNATDQSHAVNTQVDAASRPV